jgi:restriction system protein
LSDAEILAAAVAHRRASNAATRPSEPISDGDRAGEAAGRTRALDELVERLRTLCADIAPITLDLDAGRESPDTPAFEPAGLDVEEPPPSPQEPSATGGLLSRVLPGSRERHEAAVAESRKEHEQALREHAAREDLRRKALADAMAAHERAVAEVSSAAASRNREVDGLRSRIDAGDPPALAAYFAAVLAASDYPEGFPRKATVALDTANRLLVVDYELPGLDAVPAVQAVRYDARSDTFEEVPRPPARRKDLYGVVVASVALRSVKELFDADKSRSIDSVVFNGYVHGVDRATGESVRPHLVSLRVTRDDFRTIDIARTDPIVSIRNVEAQFSMNPAELAPVRQVIGVRSLGPGAAMASSPDLSVSSA